MMTKASLTEPRILQKLPFIFYIEVNLHLRISNQTGHHHLPPQQRQLPPQQRQLPPPQLQALN